MENYHRMFGLITHSQIWRLHIYLRVFVIMDNDIGRGQEFNINAVPRLAHGLPIKVAMK